MNYLINFNIMIPQPIKISLVQAQLAWADKDTNLSYFSRELDQLKGKTDLVLLPEMFATGFITDPSKISEKMDGKVLEWMKQTSATLDSVVAGSVVVEVGSTYFNRLIWMRPDGTYDFYDKRHLFRMGEEHTRFTAGNKPVIVDIKGWKVMLQICYDLRFPVWSKNRYINEKYEYDILVYLANWPAARKNAWQTLLPARAIENQSYCIGVNRVGDDGNGNAHDGGSVIIDFKGNLITGCADKESEIITHKIEYEPLKHFREQFKVALDWDAFTII
jgi:predicted amidohydrolase